MELDFLEVQTSIAEPSVSSPNETNYSIQLVLYRNFDDHDEITTSFSILPAKDQPQ